MTQALNWLRSHGGTALPSFPGLLLLLSSASSCSRTPVSVWAVQPWAVGSVLPAHAVGHCWPGPALSQCLQSSAAGLPHCSSPSLSSGWVAWFQVSAPWSFSFTWPHIEPAATWVGSGGWRSEVCCPLSVPGLLPSGQHMFSNHEKVSLGVSGEELAATSLHRSFCSFVVAMGSSGWALIQGGLKGLMPPLPGLPTSCQWLNVPQEMFCW